jgi:hypothetical protein
MWGIDMHVASSAHCQGALNHFDSILYLSKMGGGITRDV